MTMEQRLTINVPFEFRATHWLPVRSDPHDHGFQLMLTIEGPLNPTNGFVVDMYEVRKIVEPLIDGLKGSTLNGNQSLQRGSSAGKLAATYPTCETLASYFADACTGPIGRLATGVKLKAVEMHILNDGSGGMEEWGFARVEIGG
ncbi:MAG: 6-carboxytetrahydropterin synthase [Planctomycetes bacterium]|nr:6-carboxytetrahydropterin synthase [Planctomycetota bacterium]NUQ33985.1 6-carboxytetrahydropterin synthase [Planctomycetaceae bacterium]